MKLRGQPAPKVSWRIAWWFGIYLVLSELIFLLFALIGPYEGIPTEWHELLRGLLLVPLLFPRNLSGWVELWGIGTAMRLDPFNPYVCYGLYLLHLLFTARTKRLLSFLVMLGVLLILMILSVVGLWVGVVATRGD